MAEAKESGARSVPLVRQMDRALSAASARIVRVVSPQRSTQMLLSSYRRHGMTIDGTPLFVSSSAWFDGTDLSLIELGHGCTISVGVRVLTHDWSAHTVLVGLGHPAEPPVERRGAVKIGAFAFVGMCSTLLPDSAVGHHAIVGAGSVVRGRVEPYTIVAGNPAIVLGDVRDHLERRFPEAYRVAIEASGGEGSFS